MTIPAKTPPDMPFWRAKRLEEMDAAEWESLCDGCGRCCLVKLEDEDTGAVHYTDVGCQLLDAESCRCSSYAVRQQTVPDCLRLTPEAVRTVKWLPPTCAYRLLAEGRDLYWWHPLVSGDPDTPHAAGISVRGRVSGLEEDFGLDDLFDRVVDWPACVPEAPKPRRSRRN
jgi:hypothetical protein